MQTIQTHKGELIAVPTPIDANDFKVVTSIAYAFLSWGSLGASLELGSPEYRYSIIGTSTNGELDFDCEPYVEIMQISVKGETVKFYKNNVIPFAMFSLPQDAFLSLLTSHKVEYVNTKLVFIKHEK